ncbi:putative amino acid aldolase or racemase [Hoeflea sp. IMCC20628]|uniref:alanine racemase n=1 Tax=Hoeflea sp. IMCC20628 TaxID=1620421 RepID=UPI00063BEF4D|nr:alanine racemase [Hoeflea sp. IMCC20628]AKH98824.1 putative amino acid aldolase or racemase [Hoeflea sp. IMCC20628]
MTGLPEILQNQLESLDRTLDTLETPAVLIDAGIADANLVRWQQRCDDLGIANRPHIKTHRSVAWAMRQLQLGACGITVQTVGEAEVMADGGITDILLTTNVLGAAKLERLGAVAARTKLAVVADSDAVVDAVAQAARNAGASITVLVECDTGGARCGIADPSAVSALAQRISGTEGVQFGGLMTYPAAGKRLESQEALQAAISACRSAGLQVPVVTSGGSPDMWSDEGLEPVTEYRAGTYIYNDRALLAHGAATLDQCAMTVLATVVSRPTADRAIIDAGSKALTSDLLGLDGYGLVLEHPEAKLYQLNEEHGLLDVSACAVQPDVGDRIHVLPNHTCVVTNLFDRLYVVAGGQLLGTLPVDARGKSG